MRVGKQAEPLLRLLLHADRTHRTAWKPTEPPALPLWGRQSPLPTAEEGPDVPRAERLVLTEAHCILQTDQDTSCNAEERKEDKREMVAQQGWRPGSHCLPKQSLRPLARTMKASLRVKLDARR